MWMTGPAPHVDIRVIPQTNNNNTEPPAYVPFTTVLTFTENKQMFRKQVTGALQFTTAALGAVGSVAGTVVDVDLVANGSNTPTFQTPLKPITGSSAYSTTLGNVNHIRFWYTGTDVLYAIWQDSPQSVAPVISNLSLPPPYSSVILTFTKNISSLVGSPSAFVLTFSGGTTQAASTISALNNIVTLGFAPNLASAVSPTLTTTNTRVLSSIDGEYAGDVTNLAVVKS